MVSPQRALLDFDCFENSGSASGIDPVNVEGQELTLVAWMDVLYLCVLFEHSDIQSSASAYLPCDL